MKTAIIIADGIKQIMLTAENDSEKQALKMITENDDISVEFKTGMLYDSIPQVAIGYRVSECKGGYLRAFQDEQSLMIVLRERKKDKPKPIFVNSNESIT